MMIMTATTMIMMIMVVVAAGTATAAATTTTTTTSWDVFVHKLAVLRLQCVSGSTRQDWIVRIRLRPSRGHAQVGFID